jgi:hypothetical protein
MMHSASEVLAATSASELGTVPNRKEETKKKKKKGHRQQLPSFLLTSASSGLT